MRTCPAFLLVVAALLLGGCATQKIVEYPIGPAYAATEVNATIFRLQAVASDNKYQYATYYVADGKVVVARRALGKSDWTTAVMPFSGNVKDAHNDVVLGLSGDGCVHISYDQHSNSMGSEPLHYRLSPGGDEWAAFGPVGAMTGILEARVTYPTFIPGPKGDLYFFYRDGQSGNGRLCLDHYDAAMHIWRAVASPLLEGAGQSSPYWWRPEVGPDGVLHVAWCWRDTANAATNHDIYYARSRDGGKTWENSAGQVLTTPITRASNAEVYPIAKGQNLINSCSLATDAQGHPHIAYYCNGPDGVPQYFHLWFDGKTWSAQQVSRRTVVFSLTGVGTLQIPISRPEIAVGRAGTVNIITRDNTLAGGLKIYQAKPPYADWKADDVLNEPLGEWEPTYDLARWQRDGVLALFVLPVHQGNNEKTTNFPPQIARVVEITGLQ